MSQVKVSRPVSICHKMSSHRISLHLDPIRSCVKCWNYFEMWQLIPQQRCWDSCKTNFEPLKFCEIFAILNRLPILIVGRYKLKPKKHIHRISEKSFNNINHTTLQYCGERICPIQHSKYHCCWWPGSLRRQHISTHDIDYLEWVSTCLTWGRISTTCVMTIWWNDIKCKYMFLLPLKTWARKGLTLHLVVPVVSIHRLCLLALSLCQITNRRNSFFMMKSSNENFFHVTCPLCGNYAGEFLSQRPVTRSLCIFFFALVAPIMTSL